jgi:hypothetical protein
MRERQCNLATLRSAPPGRDGSSPGAGHLVAGHQPLDVRVTRLDALAHIASISTSRSFAPFDGPTSPRFSMVSTIRAARL